MKKYKFNIYQYDQRTNEVVLKIECMTKVMFKEDFKKLLLKKKKEFKPCVVEIINE